MYQHAITRNTLLLAISLSLLGHPSASSRAASTWTGLGSDNNWGTGGNWNAAPVFPTALTFAGSTRLTNNNYLSSITASSITFDAAAGAFVLGGNGITLAGNIGFNGNPAAPVTQTVNLNMAWSASALDIDTPANGNLVFGGAITSAADYSLNKTSAGTLTLGGTNSIAGIGVNGGTNIITGNTSINGNGDGNDRLYLGDGDFLNGCNGTLVIQPGAVLSVTGSFGDTFVIGRDSGSGTVIQNGGTFTFNPANNKVMLVCATGDTRTQAAYDMNGGLLDMSGNTLTVGWGATLVTGVVNQVSGVITNLGSLVMPQTSGANGLGVYTLSGGSIYIGAGGITTAGGSSRYAMNLGGGTVGAYQSWASSLNMNLTGSNGPVTFNTAANTITLSGALSSGGGLTKIGSGTLDLSGANSYSGDTTVNAGTLQLDVAGSSPGALHLASGTVLNLNFTGTNTVTGLYTNNAALPTGIYNAGNLPGFITGSGVLKSIPTWVVSPASYNFGSVITGTMAQVTFSFTNGSGITVNGTASVSTAAYSIISGSPFSVAAGGTATVTVQFAPTTNSTYNDTVQFTSGSQTINLPLTGIGSGLVTPVADFTGTPVLGIAPLPVTFVDASSGGITNRFWDFGDGTTTNTTLTTLQHTYTSAGRWTVTLKASNPLGISTNIKPAYISTAPVLRILPVGDSITCGVSSPANVPGGYRTLLASLLTSLNYNVTFTGLLNVNNPPGVTAWHEGHSGAEIVGVDYCMQGVFDSTDDPDIILLLLGTNDYNNGIGAGATNRLDAMITHLATNRPNAKIIVANLLLRTDNSTLDSQITSTFNPLVPGIVAAHAALGQQVYFTDLRSSVTAAGLSSDGIHPNAGGYACMATNWFNAITNIMGIFGATNAPVISHVVSLGGLTNVAVTFSKPVADTAANIGNFTLNGGVTISSATLDAATKRVVTLATSPLTQNASYTLTVSNVVDLTGAQTPIADGTSATFNACGARGATNNVPEASHFQLAYSLDIPNAPNYSSGVTYTVDNHSGLGAFGRVAYYLELQSTNGGPLQYVWVSMNPFTANITRIGVPTLASGAVFQQNVANMNVASSVAGIVTGTNLSGGNLEFWPYNYSQANALSVTNANAGTYDWGDQNSGNGNFGSMQIANHNASQMLLSFNAWGGFGGNADLGIGNNTVYQTGNWDVIDNLTDIQPDWTFRGNAPSYALKTLQVFIQPVPVPGTTNLFAVLGSSTFLATSNLVALAGNPGNYPLSVTAVSATSTNGSPVSLSGGDITYTPVAIGSDKFTYTLGDGHGGTAIGTVSVNSTNGLGGRVSGIAFSNAVPGLTFTGIPGYQYHVQVSTDLINWNDVLTTSAPAGGVFQFNDNAAPLPDAFYRLMWNGN
jgi:autotransporter-associated beta strand protein